MLVVLALPVLVVAVAIVVNRARGATKAAIKQELKQASSQPTVIPRHGHRLLLPMVKIIVSYLQVISFMKHFEVPWPSEVLALFEATNAGSSIPMNAGFVVCVLKWSMYSRFRLAVMLPWILMVVMLVIPLWQCLRRMVKRQRSPDARAQSPWAAYQTSVLVLLYLVYPQVTREALRMLNCSEPVDGVSYLKADFRVQCYDTTHNLHALLAMCTVVAFCIGLPLCTGVMMVRERMKHRRTHRTAAITVLLADMEGALQLCGAGPGYHVPARPGPGLSLRTACSGSPRDSCAGICHSHLVHRMAAAVDSLGGVAITAVSWVVVVVNLLLLAYGATVLARSLPQIDRAAVRARRQPRPTQRSSIPKARHSAGLILPTVDSDNMLAADQTSWRVNPMGLLQQQPVY